MATTTDPLARAQQELQAARDAHDVSRAAVKAAIQRRHDTGEEVMRRAAIVGRLESEAETAKMADAYPALTARIEEARAAASAAETEAKRAKAEFFRAYDLRERGMLSREASGALQKQMGEATEAAHDAEVAAWSLENQRAELWRAAKVAAEQEALRAAEEADRQSRARGFLAGVRREVEAAAKRLGGTAA